MIPFLFSLLYICLTRKCKARWRLAGGSLSLKPVWSTEFVPGQPQPKIYRETRSQKSILNNKNLTKVWKKVCISLLCKRERWWRCQSLYLEIRGQLAGVGFLLLLCRSWRGNSGAHQTPLVKSRSLHFQYYPLQGWRLRCLARTYRKLASWGRSLKLYLNLKAYLSHSARIWVKMGVGERADMRQKKRGKKTHRI